MFQSRLARFLIKSSNKVGRTLNFPVKAALKNSERGHRMILCNFQTRSPHQILQSDRKSESKELAAGGQSRCLRRRSRANSLAQIHFFLPGGKDPTSLGNAHVGSWHTHRGGCGVLPVLIRYGVDSSRVTRWRCEK